MQHQRNLEFSKQRKRNIKAINQWKQDLKKKGEKAQSLDFYTKGAKQGVHKFEKGKKRKITKGK